MDSHRSFVEVIGSNKSTLSFPELENVRVSKKHFADLHGEHYGKHSTFKGMEFIQFSHEETQVMAAKYEFPLIGKFSQGIPTNDALHTRFVGLGLKGAYNLGILNLKHVLIELTNRDDFLRLWTKQLFHVDGCPMRIFKWSPTFDVRIESPVVPIWIRLPGLPVHIFHKKGLYGVAALIGVPLKIDEQTAYMTRPGVACICVEIDLLQPRIEEIGIGIEDSIHVQKVIYENLPPYCIDCQHLGHDTSQCFNEDYKKKIAALDAQRKPVPSRTGEGFNRAKQVWKRKDTTITTNRSNAAPQNSHQPPQRSLRKANGG